MPSADLGGGESERVRASIRERLLQAAMYLSRGTS